MQTTDAWKGQGLRDTLIGFQNTGFSSLLVVHSILILTCSLSVNLLTIAGHNRWIIGSSWFSDCLRAWIPASIVSSTKSRSHGDFDDTKWIHFSSTYERTILSYQLCRLQVVSEFRRANRTHAPREFGKKKFARTPVTLNEGKNTQFALFWFHIPLRPELFRSSFATA